MAKHLNTPELYYHFEQLVLSSKKELILICPQLILNNRIKHNLEQLNEKKVQVKIAFNESYLHDSTIKWYNNQKNIKAIQFDEINATIYLNENQAIVTSMNPSSCGGHDLLEIGILVSKKEDKKLYNSILAQAKHLLSCSQQIELKSNRLSFPIPEINSKFGYCILNGSKIPFSMTMPYSQKAYFKYIYGKKKLPKGKFCHFSGEISQGKNSISCPVIKSNWKKAKEVFNLQP